MAINIELLKEHPYATGGVVIVGGIVVFYMLSKQGTTSQGSGSGTGNYLAADAALQQAQAAVAIQTNGQNAAIQQAQISASVANNQTAAAVTTSNTSTLAALVAALSGNKTSLAVTQSNNDAATLQQLNQEVSQQNIYAIQESGLQDQINQQFNISANNNATTLDAFKAQLAEQGAIATQSLTIAGGLATQQQQLDQLNINAIIPLAGQQKNSALDATNQTTLFQTILAHGNPTVAAYGTQASSTAAVSGNNANASNVASITAGITKLGSSLIGGLFG